MNVVNVADEPQYYINNKYNKYLRNIFMNRINGPRDTDRAFFLFLFFIQSRPGSETKLYFCCVEAFSSQKEAKKQEMPQEAVGASRSGVFRRHEMIRQRVEKRRREAL